MRDLRLGCVLSFLASLSAQEKPASPSKPVRSLAAGLVRQQVEIRKVELPVVQSGLELGAGQGPMVLLVRRADGSLETVELQRGDGDHGPAAAPTTPPEEIPEKGPEPPQPLRVVLKRAAGQFSIAIGSKGAPVTAPAMDRDACRKLLAEHFGKAREKSPPAVTIDASPEVTMQEWLTVWELARELGCASVLFDGGGAVKSQLDEAARKVLDDLPKTFEWKVEKLGGVQPICSGELLLLLEGKTTWGEVRPLILELARVGIWEIGFACRQDAKTIAKLPTHLPCDHGR